MGGNLPWLKQHLDLRCAGGSGDGCPHAKSCSGLWLWAGRRNLVRLVQEHGLPVVVIDQSESRIQQVREVPYVW